MDSYRNSDNITFMRAFSTGDKVLQKKIILIFLTMQYLYVILYNIVVQNIKL